MSAARNPWLLAGGLASVAAALAHLACIAGGSSLYRAIGAPPQVVRAVELGSSRPAWFTMGIAAGLMIAAAYAFAGAGVIRRLPLLRLGLIAIAAVYVGRGLLFRPEMLGRPDLSQTFALVSAAIVLAMGLVHAVGLWRGWKQL
ncbi:hypothetical protein MZO42_11715 [Sphingomonas psychrotolerans]|uniref:Uncharacterized protein n=1 Tax=Sphingomonas psychrotolerans TaxID=1327635 RepID=A0ABU3N7Q2_9SPHN|nr:hypothetical protein [Sphingomonas psychrotolerans]MDT8759365.1 hypothetical protein [Sphingomonas psychrotolerans]